MSEPYTGEYPTDMTPREARAVTAPTPREPMDIGGAVAYLRAGGLVAREGWNGKGMHLYLVEADPSTRIREYVMMMTVDGTIVPWVCSQSDLLANDWFPL